MDNNLFGSYYGDGDNKLSGSFHSDDSTDALRV